MPEIYKYHYLISSLNITQPCPCQNSSELNIEAFRWTHSKIDHQENFLPAKILDEIKQVPPRANVIDDYRKCTLCSISLFDSLENAKKKFNSFNLNTRNKLGYTHIATGLLEITDGVGTPIESNGHFEFFEYSNTDLASKFAIISTI